MLLQRAWLLSTVSILLPLDIASKKLDKSINCEWDRRTDILWMNAISLFLIFQLTPYNIHFFLTVRPVIVTNSATYTMKGAESGAVVQLVCKAEALPLADLTWLYYGSGETVNKTDKDVIEIKKLENTILMRVKARIGAKYLCYANNNRGNTTQLYEIRPKGAIN